MQANDTTHSTASRPRDPVRLVRPHFRHRDASLAMLREFDASGMEKYGELLELAVADFDAHLALLADLAKGIPRPPFGEPRKTYWAARADGSLVGISRLRFMLSEPARHPWGHIGLDVVPSARGRGVAGSFLAQVVREAWAIGMKALLVKVHETNEHSIRLILRCGGRRLDSVHVHSDGERYLQFAFERPD